MKNLSFNKDGKFKIMQIADVQDTQNTSPDTLNFIKKAIEKEQPDLVIFSGDQLKGYGFSFRGGNTHKKVTQAITNIVSIVDSCGVPFAVTYGNHDVQSGADKTFQHGIYASFDKYICGEVYGEDGDGTFVLEIKGNNSQKTAMNVFVLDSNSYDKENGGYACVEEEKIQWFENISKRIDNENNNKIPAIVFQHIPVFEMYSLLEKSNKSNKEAILGNVSHRDYYVLPQKLKDAGGFMLENIACPTVSGGQFQSFVKSGNVFAAFFGHDHNNSFVGKLDGIDLGYTQGSGFNVYGPGLNRGVRIFEFSQEQPQEYKTRTLTYLELMGKKVKKKMKLLFYTYAPSSVDAAKPMIVKFVLSLAAIIAAVVLAVALIK